MSKFLAPESFHERTDSTSLARQSPTPAQDGWFIGLVAVIVFFSIFGGENFMSADGAASWLNVTASELGIIALPIGLLMIAGQLDLFSRLCSSQQAR